MKILRQCFILRVMNTECLAQEKELLEYNQSRTVESFRAGMSTIKPAVATVNSAYAERGDEGVEFTMKDLLSVS